MSREQISGPLIPPDRIGNPQERPNPSADMSGRVNPFRIMHQKFQSAQESIMVSHICPAQSRVGDKNG